MRCSDIAGVELVKERSITSENVPPQEWRKLADKLGRKRADQMWHKAQILHDFLRANMSSF